jgi:hypothetical protein
MKIGLLMQKLGVPPVALVGMLTDTSPYPKDDTAVAIFDVDVDDVIAVVEILSPSLKYKDPANDDAHFTTCTCFLYGEYPLVTSLTLMY